MTKRRLGALVASVLILAAGVLLLVGRSAQAPAAQKPKLLLLTSLPLLFGEGFGLDSESSPLIEALGEHHDVAAIDTTASEWLVKGPLLVMAQPRAQTADNLVALDRWVRAGGKLLLFADPRLDWPSELALGDLNRPPPMFADTGLLGHWGLRLDAPDKAGPAKVSLNGKEIDASSPGTLVRTGGTCVIADGGLVARCVLGKGEAVIVADADLLEPAANHLAIANLVAELD